MNDSTESKIYSFYRRHKRMPSYSDMMTMFGYKSKNAVFRLVEKLVEAGTVAKDNLGRLIPTQASGDLPMLGSVKAGFPSDVSEIRDTMNIEDLVLDQNGEQYMLEVDGDSMTDAHIEDGDMIIAKRANTARDGDIVIAEIDGEWTMKYWRIKNLPDGRQENWLEPANKNFKPMYPEYSLRVAAIVKTVIRKY